MEHTNCSTSGQLPIFWDRFHHEKWLVDLACRKEEGEAQGAIHKGRPHWEGGRGVAQKQT